MDIAHANNIFRVIVSAHAHLFLIQALNVSSLLLARTTSHLVAITYLARQNEKIQQKLIALLETSESSETASKEDVRQMLLLKNVVVTQRLNSLQQRPLPGIEVSLHCLIGHFDCNLISRLLEFLLSSLTCHSKTPPLSSQKAIESVHNKIGRTKKKNLLPFVFTASVRCLLLLFLFFLSFLLTLSSNNSFSNNFKPKNFSVVRS